MYWYDEVPNEGYKVSIGISTLTTLLQQFFPGKIQEVNHYSNLENPILTNVTKTKRDEEIK